eukprot:CAMPEP_0113939712 /NCGR_PEP_ID=MMETSP1339-20121228/5986_1 /TAXON_ID=94617 /ORGANISM="Fibrocapsa japonica" /LENGTH=452 /DNA_ID=CAMNT_0000943309 /DNA_START=178 /DNA_END=1536 /DNA_ORIENTATION=- /assembly_acc=CAM_ASM_000762
MTRVDSSKQVPETGGSPIERLFAKLLRAVHEETGEEGLPCSIMLKEEDSGVRNLLATADVEKNEAIVSVPGAYCLWANRDGEIQGLAGQSDATWDLAGDLRNPYPDILKAQGLTWDLRMAVALVEATIGQGCGGRFWDAYSLMMPAPHTLTMPMCLNKRLGEELQHKEMAKAGDRQRIRLKEHFPSLMNPGYHPLVKCYEDMGKADQYPDALTWCFALVRSRVFSADDDRFAYVPFMDMVNHSLEPNADYQYDPESDSFKLVALRPIPSGEEVTISYGRGLCNDDLFQRYGFFLKGNHIGSPILGFGSVPKKLEQEVKAGKTTLSSEDKQRLRGMQDVMLSLAQQTAGSDEESQVQLGRLQSVLSSINVLVSIQPEGTLKERIVKSLELSRSYAKSEYKTAVATDERLLREENKGTNDGRDSAVIAYRLERKRLTKLTHYCLETFLEIIETE